MMGEWPPLSAEEIRTISIQKFRRGMGVSTDLMGISPFRASLLEPGLELPEHSAVINPHFAPRHLD